MPARRHAFLAAFIATIAVTACSREVVVHPPPPEDRWVSPYPPPLESWVDMNQPDADRYIVSGIREVHVEGQRWVDRKGIVQVLAPPFLELNFQMAFTLPPAVANKADGITLKIAVNDEPFGTFNYTEAGTYEIKKPVAAESLPWDRNTEISLEIEPSGNTNWEPFELGFLIKSVGFRP